MEQQTQTQNKIEMPQFLKDVPNLSKPDENEKHNSKLVEIMHGMDLSDATIACRILARRYPIEMFTALVNEMCDLCKLRDAVTGSMNHYEKEGSNCA